MQIIPLVRAKYVYAYSAVLDRLGAPKRHLLEKVGLSEQILDDPEAIIPAHQAWNFIGSAARQEGIDDLGLVAGEMSLRNYGEFSRRLLNAPNLNQALETFCQLALHEYSRAHFYVSRREDGTWFCRGPIDGNEAEKKHVELLVLTMMIETVRMAAGPDWYPSQVFLQTTDSTAVERHRLFSQSTVRFGNRVSAFEVPLQYLPRQLPQSPTPLVRRDYDRLEHEFPVAIRQVVGGMMADGPPRVRSVAQAVGATVRTLQRRLSEIDTTFSDVLLETRMQLAQRMIASGDCELIDVAHAAGYSDQSHFSRAFQRWTGVSPGKFRRLESAVRRNSRR